MSTLSFIGAGNVAFRLSIAFHLSGHTVECICNRSAEKAEQVVRALKRHRSKAFATNRIEDIPDSDIIVIAVSDDAIDETAALLKNRKSLIVHTSGAVPMSVLRQTGGNYGVFYPLMTLSRNKDLDIRMIPFLIEACGPEGEAKLTELVRSLKAEYKICDSRKRLQMHAAAVFATNFINHLLGLAYDISCPDFTLLLPCAIETVRKAFLQKPQSAQTGPARRKDLQTIEKHLKLLESAGKEDAVQVYRLLTRQIMEKYKDPDGRVG